MGAENLAAEYVALIDRVWGFARTLAEGRWDDAEHMAPGLVRAAELVADEAMAVTGTDDPFSADRLRACIAGRIAAGHGPRGVLEFLDPKLKDLDPSWKEYLDWHDVPPEIAAPLP
jgi:hypothetical protein